MGRGARQQHEVAAAGTPGAAPRRAAKTDPVVDRIAAVLRGELADRKLRESLSRSGLLISVPSRGWNPPRLMPSRLGAIIAEKGRLPTPTEIARTIKQLDRELAANGVSGDVTSGSFSYQPPSHETGQILQQRLIHDRQAIAAYLQARDQRQFEAVRIRNAPARVAQQRLIAELERKASHDTFISDTLRDRVEQIRSGVISVADAASAVRKLTPAFIPGHDDNQLTAEAIRVGLGLPTTKDQIIDERERQAARFRATLDRVDAGEQLDDGELRWSRAAIADARVRRAAFGYCQDAHSIGADYHHAVIIELHDGAVGLTDVKRAHSPLEPHVQHIADHRDNEQQRIADAEEFERRARTELRRWTRKSDRTTQRRPA